MLNYLLGFIFALMSIGSPDPTMTYTEPQPDGTLYVELSDGAWYFLPPCDAEDDYDCYWDADSRGNGQGDSWVDVAGFIFYP